MHGSFFVNFILFVVSFFRQNISFSFDIMFTVVVMKQVIYIDVLFVLNFFITYFLIFTTKHLLKTSAVQWRMILAAVLGGAYSLIILLPEMHFLLSGLLKIISACIIVAAAFRFSNFVSFLKGVAFFFTASFIYVGVMIALWFAFRPFGLVINNSVVYFGITPKVLVVSTLLAYLISFAVIKIHNKITSKNQLYSVTVLHHGQNVTFPALVDMLDFL